MVLLLEGLQIPREFRPRLRDGTKCTLQLPANWRNDFCGFLMCAVTKHDPIWGISPNITMKQVRGSRMGIAFEDAVVWKESVNDKKIHGWAFISGDELCRGFGVSLVPRTGGSGPTDTSLPQYYSEFDKKNFDFKPEFGIDYDYTCTFRIPSILDS
ncbi:hypothetical protein Tco_0071222 [Tanacetum coccineum]